MDIEKKARKIAKDVGKTKDVFEDGDVIRFDKGYKKARNAFRSLEDLVEDYGGRGVEVVVEESVKYYTFAAIRAGGYWYVTGDVAGASKISYKELVENYLADELTRNIVIASEWVDVS